MASTGKASKSGGRILTFVGLLAGAAVGAALALIYSPGNGEKNREDLNRWAHSRLDDLQAKVEGAIK
jgi:gas vesicle protein